MAVAAAQPLFATGPDASLIWVWPALFTFPAFGFVAWLGEAGWGGDARRGSSSAASCSPRWSSRWPSGRCGGPCGGAGEAARIT
ncbi:hypothetical protein SVIOM342S_01595 [Streptomyces violaceorubidus]